MNYDNSLDEFSHVADSPRRGTKCVELSLVAVYTVTYRFRSPKILAALSQGQKRRKCLKWENIVFRKWKIYVIICNPRASSKTAEHRLDRASIAEPDMSKRGARAICRRGNVVHEFTASIMNLPPTNAPHLITDDVRRCGFIPSPFSSRKALGVNAGVTLLIFFLLCALHIAGMVVSREEWERKFLEDFLDRGVGKPMIGDLGK